MRDQQWVKTLDDGRMVKFTYQGLVDGGAFITAQIAENEIVYSIMLTKARNSSNRADVERRLEGEFSKKWRPSLPSPATRGKIQTRPFKLAAFNLQQCFCGLLKALVLLLCGLRFRKLLPPVKHCCFGYVYPLSQFIDVRLIDRFLIKLFPGSRKRVGHW